MIHCLEGKMMSRISLSFKTENIAAELIYRLIFFFFPDREELVLRVPLSLWSCQTQEENLIFLTSWTHQVLKASPMYFSV